MDFILQKHNGSWRHLKAYEEYSAKVPDGRYRVTMEPVNQRTIPMNNYLHGVLIPEFRFALNSKGYEVLTDADAKAIMKAMFLKESVINKETGEYLETIRDTSSLTRQEMSDLYDRVIRFCVEKLDHQIGYPNEQLSIV